MKQIACDVLVAGSGAGGLTAALTASLQGLDVIVAEKESVFGGTTAYSAGVIWIPDNSHAERAGLGDSKEAALTYIASEAGSSFEPVKAQAFVAHARQMLDYLERNSHVSYQLIQNWADYHPLGPGASQGGRSMLPKPFDGRLLGKYFDRLRAPISTMMLFGGMSVSRSDIPHLFNATRSIKSGMHVLRMMLRYAADRARYPRGTAVANGNALIARLALSLLEREVPLWLESPVTQLIRRNGRVTGAVVQRLGEDIEVVARRGVVLAAGGFPRHEGWRAQHYAHVAEGKNHVPLAPPGNTGDGARMAMQIGGKFNATASNSAAWVPVSLLPDMAGGQTPYPHFIDRCKPGFIAVDRRGRRFANEADSYHDFVPLMVKACANDPVVESFLVCDHTAIRRYGLGVVPPFPMPIRSYIKRGYLLTGNTPEELAKRIGVDAQELARTLESYNANARQGHDPEFGKGSNSYNHFGGDPLCKPNPNLAPIETGPFYAVRLVPGDLGTFRGLATDEHARVLEEGSGAAIPGLYAVGNDMASVMGGAYPGAGITIGPAMTFGYIAGMQLAQEGAPQRTTMASVEESQKQASVG